MNGKKKLAGLISLAVLVPMLLYVAGIIAQLIININEWKAAGSNYGVSPGLPSLNIADAFGALFHFPEGILALGGVIIGSGSYKAKASPSPFVACLVKAEFRPRENTIRLLHVIEVADVGTPINRLTVEGRIVKIKENA